VERRRRLVGEVGGEVEDMREELARMVEGAGAGGGGQKGGGKASASGYGPLSPDGDGDGDGDEYAAFEQQKQVEMMHEQDEALDGVFQTVGNLRRQADDMGRELEEQGEMLGDVDTVADRVGGKLQGGIKRVGWVIRKNEGVYEVFCFVLSGLIMWGCSEVTADTMSSCCIGVLILVLILLLVLVLVL